jgi:hypothetical protein
LRVPAGLRHLQQGFTTREMGAKVVALQQSSGPNVCGQSL